jgi:PKD repeat protein
VGIFGATEVSYSGPNDGYAPGIIDAIWPDPQIDPQYGSGGAGNPIPAHGPIYTMGDILNHSKMAMEYLWGTHQTTWELHHYYGDPAMKIWTAVPTTATASHPSSLPVGATSLDITGSNCGGGIAALVYEDILVGKTTLAGGGTGTITFSALSGNEPTAVLTVSKHNYKPYIANIPVSSGPPTAAFTSDTVSVPLAGVVNFTDQSTGGPTSWSWTFEGGTPATSTDQNPSVTYNSAGTFDVSLTVTNPNGSDSETKTDYITVYVPSPPAAEFTASATNIEEGQSVTFTDQSTNSPTSWSWTFEGGTPATSTDQNPSITYNSAGTFDVSLTVTNSGGSDTETKIDYITVTAPLPTVGNTTVFATTSTTPNRRAMPFTMPEDGTIRSVTMYHEGGSGGLILGVYDGEGTPQNRLGVTPTTTIDGSAGWQTINLTSPAFAAGGTTVWLAWVYESIPGVRYQTGSPGRFQSDDLWAGGMPDPFGTGTQSDYLYSIYASYVPGGGPIQYTLTTNTVGNGSITLDPPGGVYDEGTVVTLTAVPDVGWQFDHWSGDLSGSQNPTIITMDADKSVTANFSKVWYWYTLTVNIVGQGSVTLDPPGGTYIEGTIVTLTAEPDTGWQFDNWSGDLTGTANPETITMDADKNVTANFSDVGTQTVGNTTVFGSTSVSTYRRAMPFTMPQNGNISSVTMYHEGGSGGLILAVYDGEGTPQNRLGVTPTTTINSSAGWQTINLTGSAYVAGGSTVWLAWVYESNPGIRYEIGSPGRYQSGDTWSGGMPDPFGSGSQSSYLYSIYATYTPSGGPTYGTVGNTTILGSTSVTPNRRAMPFTMSEDGTIESITMYHEGGSGGLILAVYDGSSLPQNRLGVTPSTTINSSAGWQTINLTTPVSVTGGTTIWLAWVYESIPGVRYEIGSPGRAQSGDLWSGGMPDPFGSSTQSDFIYSIYATYSK